MDPKSDNMVLKPCLAQHIGVTLPGFGEKSVTLWFSCLEVFNIATLYVGNFQEHFLAY